MIETREEFHRRLNVSQVSFEQLADEYFYLENEFACYRETAEETSQCYHDSHQDSWVFEQALREIAKNGENASVLAQQTLDRIWKRREERSKPKDDNVEVKVCINNEGSEGLLTIGKEYEMLEYVGDKWVWVRDDRNGLFQCEGALFE